MRGVAFGATALLAALLVAAATSHAWDRATTPPGRDWSAVRQTWPAVGAMEVSLAALEEGVADGALVVVAPSPRGWRDSELAAIERFASSGGAVLVLGDGDAAARLGLPMLADKVHEPSGRVEIHVAGGAAGTVSHAYPLAPADDATILWRSADASFLDVDGLGTASGADVAGPFPLAARRGNATVVGADILANSPDAAALLGHLRADLPATHVLVDDTRSGGNIHVVESVALLLAHARILGAAAMTLAVAAAVAAAHEAFRPPGRRREPSLDDPLVPEGEG